MEPRAGAVLAVLVLVAGCSAPTGSGSPSVSPPASETTTPSPPSTTLPASPATTTVPSSGPITVVGGPLPVDVNRVWSRVQALLGTNVTPPESVVVRPPAETTIDRPSRFYTVLTGVEPRTDPASGVGGHVRNPDTVNVRWSANASSPARFEQVLVHEFVHVVQFRRNWGVELRPNGSTGRNLPFVVRGGLLQGGAIYVADAYTDRYLDDATRPSTRLLETYRTTSPDERYLMRQNYFGYRYVAARIDSPRNLSTVYRNPSRTTEQLLHRLPPGKKSPVRLRVRVNRSGGGGWIRVGNRTAGELFVRSVLATELSPETAASAARGWGNDRLVTFWNGTTYGYLWTLRWDDARNASEFGAAFERFLDARATRTGVGWRANGTLFDVRWADDETLVVRVGPRAFVRNASVRVS